MEQSINQLIDLYQLNENNQLSYKIKFKNVYFCNNLTKLCNFLKHVEYATSLIFIKTDLKKREF